MKRFSKLIGFIVVFIAVIAAFCTVSFAATIGQPLTSPDAGWRRIDDYSSKIKVNGPCEFGYYNELYCNGSMTGIAYKESNIHFKFSGTKLRIIAFSYSGCYDGVKISIDGVSYSFNSSSSSAKYQNLVFEKTGLTQGAYDVIISPPDEAPTVSQATVSKHFYLDAIDIDDSGDLIKLDDVIGIGDLLIEPEEGWNRYDDRDTKIEYSGESSIWNRWSDTTHSLWQRTGTDVSVNSKITIKFSGTKVRLLGITNYYRPQENFLVTIDGIETTCNVYKAVLDSCKIFYENKDLSQGIHTLILSFPTVSSGSYDFDCIDTDGILLDAYTPSLLSAIPNDKSIILSWDKVTDATNYKIQRSTTPGGPYSPIAATSDITYTDTEVESGITYYYVVSAIVNGIEGPNSNEASATPEVPPIIGNSAILEITMVTGEVKEYDLTATELQSFLI